MRRRASASRSSSRPSSTSSVKSMKTWPHSWRTTGGGRARYGGQPLGQQAGVGLLAVEDAAELGQLGVAHRRLHLAEPPVEAHQLVAARGGLPVVAQQAQALGEGAVIGGDHAALAGGDVL